MMDDPYDQTKRRTPIGCLLVLVPIALLGWCTRPIWNWENMVLPSTIHSNDVLAASSQSGLMTGCLAAVYRLSEKAALRIQRDGIGYLQNGARPRRESPGNRYGDWHETPGDIDVARNGEGAEQTVYGLYAMGGCGDRSGGEWHSREISQALSRPSSFYTTTQNREGIIIVMPHERLIAYYYWG